MPTGTAPTRLSRAQQARQELSDAYRMRKLMDIQTQGGRFDMDDTFASVMDMTDGEFHGALTRLSRALQEPGRGRTPTDPDAPISEAEVTDLRRFCRAYMREHPKAMDDPGVLATVAREFQASRGLARA